MSDPAVASATPVVSEPTKPQGTLTLQQAVAAQLAKLESARAPTPPPVAAETAETTNPDEVQESEQAEGVEGVEAAPEEQAEAGDQSPGTEVSLVADSEIILPNGERWTGQDLIDGIMKAKDYTRKTQALQAERQTLERYTTEVRNKVEQIQQDLVARSQQVEDSLKEAASRRDHYSEQLRRITEAQREQVTQWDRVDWDRVQRETPERIGPLLLQRDQAREALQKAEREQQQLEGESKAETEQRQQQAREAYARAWVGQKQALLEHVREAHPVFTDPAKGNVEWAKIDRTLKAVGMPDDVVQAAFGARHDPNVPLISPPIFELIRKAALFDAAVAQTRAPAAGKPATDLAKIRVVKADAPVYRPPAPDKAAVGRAQAQFNRTFSLKDAKAVELAKYLSRRT